MANGSDLDIINRLTRIEELLARLVRNDLPTEQSVANEAAVLRMQGRDLGEFLKAKARMAPRRKKQRDTAL